MENTEITVIIPPEKEFSEEIYTDIKNCYLAKALTKIGFKDVIVGGNGRVYIGDEKFAANDFDSSIVEEAFKKQEELTVVLIKSKITLTKQNYEH